jgi:hypothetical protein
MNQTMLRIRWPQNSQRSLWASDFRERVAALDEKCPAFFNRDESGQTINDLPGVRFCGARGWVGVVADEASKSLLMAQTGNVIAAASQYFEQPCPVAIEAYEFGIAATQHPINYVIREMALRLKTPKARQRPVVELVRERLVATLEREALKYGLDCPSEDQLEIFGIEIERELAMKVSFTEAVDVHSVKLVNVRFQMHAELKGHWFTGYLTSRGYGRIIRMDKEGQAWRS